MAMYLKGKFFNINSSFYQPILSLQRHNNWQLDGVHFQQKSLHSRCFRFYSTNDDQQGPQTRSYYDVLEVDKNATQEEIKKAYYNLSKIYHPDINKDSEDAAVKFQELTDAYEVLGNYYLRKKYDKGILHTVWTDREHGGITGHHIEHEKFYHSRLSQGSSRFSTKTETHDYDTWGKEHYSRTVISRANVKKKLKMRKEADDLQKSHEYLDKALLYLVLLIIGSMSFLTNIIKKDDKPPTSKKST